MANQVGSSSPFGDAVVNDQKNSANTDNFSFRTMQDDLLAMKKNPGQGDFSPENISSPMPEAEPFKKAPEPAMQERTVPPFAKAEAAPVNKEEEIKEIPISEEAPQKSLFFVIGMIVVSALVLAIIGLGIYYFWTVKNQEKTVVDESVQIQQPVEETPEATPVPVEKYSSVNPNYLTLDLTTLSSEDIKAIIVSVAGEVKESSTQTPYEFVVVDANNNPVAFQIFAIAAKLNLSPAVLNTLGENFSLFIYNDSGNTRLSLAADIKSAQKKDFLAAELLKEEKTLPADTAFLFLDTQPERLKGDFASSIYNNNAIRFINLDSQRTLSIDYTLQDNKLFIGTSKNTLRAVLDKITAKNNPLSATEPDTKSGSENPASTPVSNNAVSNTATYSSNF
jgi:hypothetical protein